jgi:hypothetical protein
VSECNHCHQPLPVSADRCPHCGSVIPFPNVRACGTPGERAALERRYQDAYNDAASRGTVTSLKGYEQQTAQAQAVIARSALELARLASSDNELYATYYQLIEGGVRMTSGGKWDTLRGVADKALFPGYEKHIRFAALTLNGLGLVNYGECSMVLRSDMISHRASVFEENSVVFMNKHGIRMSEADRLPEGYRAEWSERGKIAALKASGELLPDTTPDEYPGLLLRQGTSTEDDRFVEAHIWGSMTIRTVERVVMLAKDTKRRSSRAILAASKEWLKKAGVTLEVV